MPEDRARTIALTVIGIVAAVVVVLALFIKFALPKIKELVEDRKREKKYERERIAAEEARVRLEAKKKRLSAYWVNNRTKIHAALKKVFYPELVNRWENLSDMLSYEVKDICPHCGKKLDKSYDKFSSVSNEKRSVNAQTSYGAPVKLVWEEQRYDGGYFKEEITRCYRCNKKLSELSGQYNRNDKKMNESYKREAIEWRKPEVETALGRELCDFIDSYGNFKARSDFKRF